jgi:hypothetical protein
LPDIIRKVSEVKVLHRRGLTDVIFVSFDAPNPGRPYRGGVLFSLSTVAEGDGPNWVKEHFGVDAEVIKS